MRAIVTSAEAGDHGAGLALDVYVHRLRAAIAAMAAAMDGLVFTGGVGENAPVRTLVIAAREDLQTAREVRQVLGPQGRDEYGL